MIKNTSKKAWFKFMVAAVVLAIPAIIAASYGQAQEHAAEGHAAAGLPTVVILQFINFFLYVGLVVYFARTPVVEYFKNRQAKFYSALKRADEARAAAQAQRADVLSRIAKLEATRDESIQNARREAAALRAQIVDEAKNVSVKLRSEAERTAAVEIDRAKHALREDLLNQSVQMAQRMLTDKMQDQDQKRLQDEFVAKIQGGGSSKTQSVTQ